MIDENIKDFILKAEAKALATIGDDGINVVPVSTIYFQDEKFILIDYFMDKTVNNILKNRQVAMTAWQGLEGYQIKSDCEYVCSGDLFERLKTELKIVFPERDVKGILLLDIKKVYNISPR